MKISRRCKKCGSWSKPVFKLTYEKGELEAYLKFIQDNQALAQSTRYIPLALGGTEKNNELVVPDASVHPCTLCSHGARTPGAIPCAYERNCTAIAYHFLLISKEQQEKPTALRIDEFGLCIRSAAGPKPEPAKVVDGKPSEDD